MEKENKKKIKKILGFSAKIIFGGVYVAAAIGAAPFDRGILMKDLGRGISGSGHSVFSEIDRWSKE